jgi:lipopolysaccharide biosynthesis protein
MNNKKLFKKLIEKDKKYLELSSWLSKKKVEVYFERKNLIEIYHERLSHQIRKYGFSLWILFRLLKSFGINQFGRFDDTQKYTESSEWIKKNVASTILPLENHLTDFDDMKIAVIAHIFHVDKLPELFGYLKNIPCHFQLLVSTNSIEKKIVINDEAIKNGIENIEIKVCPNRGRDLAPFLIEFRDQYQNYDVLLHIHTKKSPHNSDLSGWGDFLFKNLLGSREIICSVLTVFKQYSSVGMISPEHFIKIADAETLGWSTNYLNAKSLLDRMGVDISINDRFDFPSGSMFWARPATLEPIIKLNLHYDDFPEEDGQVDGTLAHSVERILFYSCELSGYDWIKTITPSLQVTGYKRIEDVALNLSTRLLTKT